MSSYEHSIKSAKSRLKERSTAERACASTKRAQTINFKSTSKRQEKPNDGLKQAKENGINSVAWPRTVSMTIWESKRQTTEITQLQREETTLEGKSKDTASNELGQEVARKALCELHPSTRRNHINWWAENNNRTKGRRRIQYKCKRAHTWIKRKTHQERDGVFTR